MIVFAPAASGKSTWLYGREDGWNAPSPYVVKNGLTWIDGDIITSLTIGWRLKETTAFPNMQSDAVRQFLRVNKPFEDIVVLINSGGPDAWLRDHRIMGVVLLPRDEQMRNLASRRHSQLHNYKPSDVAAERHFKRYTAFADRLRLQTWPSFDSCAYSLCVKLERERRRHVRGYK
jgi:hypothetical protein